MHDKQNQTNIYKKINKEDEDEEQVQSLHITFTWFTDQLRTSKGKRKFQLRNQAVRIQGISNEYGN